MKVYVTKDISYVDLEDRIIIDSYEQLPKSLFLFNVPSKYAIINDEVEESLFNYDGNVIQIVSSIDKRLKVYKDHKKDFIFIKPYNYQELKEYILNNSNFNVNEANRLIEYSNSNLGIIKQEISKGIFDCYNYPEDVIFKLCDEILNFSVKKSTVDTFLLSGASLFQLLPLLSNKCVEIMNIKENGAKNWKEEKALQYPISNDKLNYLIKICYNIDKDIKEYKYSEKAGLYYLLGALHEK